MSGSFNKICRSEVIELGFEEGDSKVALLRQANYERTRLCARDGFKRRGILVEKGCLLIKDLFFLIGI